MADGRIVIATEIDDSGMRDDLRQAVRQVNQVTDEPREININVKVDTSQLNAKIENTINTLTSSMNSILTSMNSLVAQMSYNIQQAEGIAPTLDTITTQTRRGLLPAVTNVGNELADVDVHYRQIASDTQSASRNTDNLDRHMQDVEDTSRDVARQTGNIETAMRGASQTANVLKSKLSGLLVSLTALLSVRALYNLGRESIEYASDLQEVQNVVDTAFEDMTYKMEQFADTAIELYGISALTAKQTGSTFMSMARGMGLASDEASDMSIQLTALSADMASFFNVSQDVASTALNSIFTGETETLKKFGVVMTENNLQAYAQEQGITKSITKMTQLEKVMLRYNYVMAQTTLAQGDFAKTSDSWANQVRILQERWKEFMQVIGTSLVQVLTPAIHVLNQFVASLVTASRALAEFLGVDLSVESATTSVTNATSDLNSAIADTTSETEKAVKTANKALGAYDKLNVISKKSSSDDDGGIGNLGVAKVDISSTTVNNADKTNKSLDGIKSLAKKITGLFKDWDKTFDDIQKSIDKISGGFSKMWESAKAGDFKGIGAGLSDVIIGVFDLIHAIMAGLDWDSIGQSIGEFLSGVDFVGIIYRYLRFKWDLWTALLKIWWGSFKAAPFETMLVTAFALLNLTPLGGILKAKIVNAIIQSGFISAIGTALSTAFASLGGFGGIFTMDLATIMGAGTAVEIGMVIATGLIAGLVTAFASFEITKLLMQYLLPSDANWYKNFKWFGEEGFFATISDDWSITQDAIWNMMTDFSDMVFNGIFALIDGIRAGVSALIEGITNDIYDVAEVLAVIWQGIAEVFQLYIANPIKAFGAWIGDSFVTLATDIYDISYQVVTGIRDIFVEGWDDLVRLFTEVIIPFFPNALDFIMESIFSFVDDVRDITSDVVYGLRDTFKMCWDWIQDDIDTVTEVVMAVINGLKDVFKGFTDWLKDDVNTITEVINAMIEGLESGINAAIRALNALHVSVPDWVPGYGGRTFGFNLSQISLPKIPYLATGAVLPANNPFLAVVGDQKSGTNVEAPLSTITQAMIQALQKTGINGNNDIVINIDGNEVFRVVRDKNEEYRRMSGASAF